MPQQATALAPTPPGPRPETRIAHPHWVGFLRSAIHAFVADRARLGQLPRSIGAKLLDPALDTVALSALRIDEDGIGLDSLARIDLVTGLSRTLDLGRTGLDDYLLVSPTLGSWADLIGQHISMLGGDCRVVFSTSGSTDIPREVPHNLTDLFEEIAALVSLELPGNAGCARVVGLVPSHHIYGFLFTVCLPSYLRLDAEDAWTRTIPGAFRNLRPGDILIGTPQNWSRLAELGASFPPDVRGVVSAGPMPAALWHRLADLGLAQLTEIYGSTETAGVGWRSGPAAAFELMPHLSRQGDGVTRRAGPPLELQDSLDWSGDRRFHVIGRRDKAVQVDGVNVSLGKVRRLLEDHPAVAKAAIRPHAGRLKAFVVPVATDRTQEEDLESDLIAWMQASLPAPARPAHYRFGPELPTNAMGKLADWSVQG